ncbi:cytidine deaminase [Flavobacterium johnsoniae]|jgi:cytidine deaminase|uniref:Cytidine deaminase n=1 Tax=Flavobacterium johnsoniae (strain ATCC 17061 / DSM 2064 / JCM 8514 / BCRC 14874 / CCUG 350202 / NBRC 14942 / NCIMB 11054 / UW101) TaxID=376686 RepID=A5FJN9_FLAJ1|nr:cytidine deaminase [Flavobacterium johnsoniae]ABQ04586.1 cytidine deaminase [Flavobacterium johnsoniae UW101]OXE97908.1 cytidine deaminase [Flavobacterium johnsoniae UW101]WQG83618.1 cytidine deaminase [Flavobacterium johnsoniae UW101]SHK27001.1 cytidine deaminase [Flavobacterium johnsoniae]
MKEISITSSFTIYDTINELSQDVQDLMNQAIEIRKKAYAPYSKFRVGAALLLDNGKVILGSNQENAAYPSGLCAERTAIFYAGSIYPEAKILKMAITAASDTNQTQAPIPPCGSCRQSIAEYEIKQDTPIEIYFMGEIGEVYKSASLKNLLPFMFDKKFL